MAPARKIRTNAMLECRRDEPIIGPNNTAAALQA